MPGVWNYAGMSGIAIGLDFNAALSRLSLTDDTGLDTHAVRDLLLSGEAAALNAMAESREDQNGET